MEHGEGRRERRNLFAVLPSAHVQLPVSLEASSAVKGDHKLGTLLEDRYDDSLRRLLFFKHQRASMSVSALHDMLPSWSTVILVSLLGVLFVASWVIRGVSLESIVASYRLLSQGTIF